MKNVRTPQGGGQFLTHCTDRFIIQLSIPVLIYLSSCYQLTVVLASHYIYTRIIIIVIVYAALCVIIKIGLITIKKINS